MNEDIILQHVTPYVCSDGRVRAYIKSTHKVVSYPRILMEYKLGRKLKATEQVHHIDGNPLNNNINNLELLNQHDHLKLHADVKSIKYEDKLMVCPVCGKEFIWSAKQQKERYRNSKRSTKLYIGPFCSKSCSGRLGTDTQNSRAEWVDSIYAHVAQLA